MSDSFLLVFGILGLFIPIVIIGLIIYGIIVWRRRASASTRRRPTKIPALALCAAFTSTSSHSYPS